MPYAESNLAKVTIITWASAADQVDGVDFNLERAEKVESMVQEGKTDGIHIPNSDVTTTRFWVDQAAAEEYIAFIMDLAVRYNRSILSTQIQDNV